MVSSEEWRFTKHAWIATLFAVVTGYADVVSLVRYQAFASFLTGNAIWLGRVAVDPKSDDEHTGCLVRIKNGKWKKGSIGIACLVYFSDTLLQ